jgi:hypothetical protein
MGGSLLIEVKTPCGESVILDRETYDSLQYKSISLGGHGYPQIFHDGKVRTLHSVVMGVGNGTGYSIIVDHINRNKLDNRRENLRPVSPTRSNLNRKDLDRPSGLPPCVYTKRDKFYAQVSRHRIKYNLGTYLTPGEAAEAVRTFKLEYDSGDFR